MSQDPQLRIVVFMTSEFTGLVKPSFPRTAEGYAMLMRVNDQVVPSNVNGNTCTTYHRNMLE